MIDIVMRLIPTSLPPCTLPYPPSSSCSPTPIFRGTLPHLFYPLYSLSPRVARLILFHHTSNRPDTHHAGKTQGPQHLHGEACGGVRGRLRPLRGWGGEDTPCYEQMSPGPEQQAGGMPRGKRRSEGPTPAAQPGEGGGINPGLSKHSSFTSLSSPCSPLPPPIPLLTVQLGN